jgi:hypothetical protein
VEVLRGKFRPAADAGAREASGSRERAGCATAGLASHQRDAGWR